MDLRSIISVPGMSGLYKVLSQAKNGVIVESLLDKKRSLLSSSHRISSLDSISVFTMEKDIPLEEVFVSMKKIVKKEVNLKEDDTKLKEEFKAVLPDFDQERVRVSDIKKMFAWYNILKDFPEAWVEKKEEEDGKTPVIPGAGGKVQHQEKRETGKVNTHGAGTRGNIPQKKGGS